MLNIKIDSNNIKKGDTFVAIKGHTVDGHDYINSAIKNGASTIVCEYGEYDGVKVIHVENTKKYLQDYLVENYQNIINQLTFIGVTGTNGKTTTCFLTYETLLKLGVNACYIGTIGYYDKFDHYELSNTTPNILELYEIFLNAINKGITTVIMEVSSHSLVEKRVEGIKYHSIGFTNLTQDHLDYHINMENYLNAKLLLLKQLNPNSIVIFNEDDSYGKYFKQNNSIGFGFHSNDLQIIDYQDIKGGSLIDFLYQGKHYHLKTMLKNLFNVYNYIMSVLLVHSLGYEIEDIISYSNEISAPRGRCETILYENKEIVVDYAHTPDAVEKIINSFNQNKNGKIITVIGCGGDRDKTKRPQMGSIATNNSYYVVLTSDNPRTENPEEIINDIVKGINKSNYEIISDRKKAIERGIDLLNENDTLLILGKGHENYQIIGHTKYHLDDLEIASNYIKKLDLNQ